ncbi:hypothetical protein MLD38_005072 [Melastoma candidum]|uniref:Uncharacterized protein n=1 Tax=Melastoma candidum TaxID=119954 RepID=A0ACB9S906_9MYRT|nr:hypothetical protein MLD38_005072 [Melastoma candidum]
MPLSPRSSRLLLHTLLSHNRPLPRLLCTGASAYSADFSGRNAYEVLGVSETCSFSEIKASFRRLVKETHPDVAGSSARGSARFLQILAAYEILSDNGRRSHYDRYLLSQKRLFRNHPRERSSFYFYSSQMTLYRQMEVVEWLKWYREAINDVVAEKKAVNGTGYFDLLERDFHSAIYKAYYGPVIESLDLLPDSFEAEERSFPGTSEVLHLVSGRDLFGMVCLADKVVELSKLMSSRFMGSEVHQEQLGKMDLFRNQNISFHPESSGGENKRSDAYKDLELHISGRLVAKAIRLSPQSCRYEIRNDEAEDAIIVFLNDDAENAGENSGNSDKFHSKSLLGTILGLGTSPQEGACFVYDSSGIKSHMILKHRTLLVKHLHWYQLNDKNSFCECRSSRARLPSSKFWLFEPRCGMHDIGGWYIETFGRDSKNKTVLSRRFWDGFSLEEQVERRLHPAMYLLALGYRTLDIEDANRRKETMREVVEGQLSGFLSWCKKLV